MSKFARGLSSGLVRIVAFLLPVVTFLAAAQAPSAPGLGARERITRAADRVLILFIVHEVLLFVGDDACAHNLFLQGRPFIMRLRQLSP